MRLKVVPLELNQANEFVLARHRHHRDVYRLNHKFSCGCEDDSGTLRGVAIIGRPVAHWNDHRWRLEVHRVCTDGTPNACSILYGAAARAAKALGYRVIGTYTRQDEPGTSLRAAGWSEAYRTCGTAWDQGTRPRTEQTEIFPRIYWQRVLQS